MCDKRKVPRWRLSSQCNFQGTDSRPDPPGIPVPPRSAGDVSSMDTYAVCFSFSPCRRRTVNFDAAGNEGRRWTTLRASFSNRKWLGWECLHEGCSEQSRKKFRHIECDQSPRQRDRPPVRVSGPSFIHPGWLQFEYLNLIQSTILHSCRHPFCLFYSPLCIS